MRIKSAFLLSLFLCAIPVTGAVSQEMPPHLGGILSALSREATETLSHVNADKEYLRHASEQSLKTLKNINANVYARTPVKVDDAVKKLQEDLGFTPGSGKGNAFMQDIWHMPDGLVRKKITELDKSLDSEKILSSLDKARSGGGLKTTYVLPLDDGKSVTVDWQPDTGKTTLDVASDGSVDEEYVATMEGAMPLKYDEAKNTYTLAPEASGTPPEIATAEDLDARRQSILGEWVIDGIGTFIIEAANEKAGDVARSKKEIQSEIDEKRREIEKTKADKYHLWKNSETKAEERQEKFRRLEAPWSYAGDIPKDANHPEKIARLDKEIADLETELKGDVPPAVAQDPIGFERVKAYPKSRSLSLEFIMSDDCRLIMDEAYFDGRTLAARTTQKNPCSMGDHLPPAVRNKLATGGWNPPLWLMARVDETEGNKIIALAVSQHGMRVKYNPESFDVSGILEPHMDISGTGRRADEQNQKYTVAEGVLP